MRDRELGFSLIEIIVVLSIVLILVGMLMPAAVPILEAQRAQGSVSDLETVYRAIVGNPSQNHYGYLGDVEDYPATLLDLVDGGASPPAGWDGPYVTNVQLDDGMLIDAYGGGIEYFQFEDAVAAVPDSLALISKGPDRTSTNTATNPNDSTLFTGTLPPDAAYASDPTNQDNIAFPHFVENVNLLNYEPIGTLAYSIFNNDTEKKVGAIVPACPALFTMTVTSVPRGVSDQTSLAFTPGLTDDLVQGGYDVTVTSALGTKPVWEERVTIQPSATVTRTLNLSVDSKSTPKFTLIIVNNTADELQVFEFNKKLKPDIKAGESKSFVVNGCAPIMVKNKDIKVTIDQFTMPLVDNTPIVTDPTFPLSDFTKTYPAALFTLCLTNTGAVSKKVIILEQGLVRGTIHTFGRSKRKCFSNVQAGNIVSFATQDGTIFSSAPMPSADVDVPI